MIGNKGIIDGVVLTGGAALNVLANQALRRAFPSLPVYVAAAPSDCGLGMVLSLTTHISTCVSVVHYQYGPLNPK
jgi:predicted NodU family carbamoyl transferase